MTVGPLSRALLGRVESLWYEASPYLYVVVGLAAALFNTSAVGALFGALLLAVSLCILRRRRSYRSHASEHLRKYARPH